jgi:hypothetical protein
MLTKAKFIGYAAVGLGFLAGFLVVAAGLALRDLIIGWLF